MASIVLIPSSFWDPIQPMPDNSHRLKEEPGVGVSHCNTHFYINIRKSYYRISPTGEKVKVPVLLN